MSDEAYKSWQCRTCGYIYDEEKGDPDEGIAPGTRWAEIPDDWVCPECGTPKSDFDMVETVDVEPANAHSSPFAPASAIVFREFSSSLEGRNAIVAFRCDDGQRRERRSGEGMTKAILGIIGGSGIYDLPGLENVREEAITSPWGEPSAPVRHGTIAGLPIVFMPRHDKGHRLSPSDINYRANIDVLKRAGVTDLISLSACGSFKEELPPGTFVLVDQFVDRTHKRESSFFGKGCVAHVSMAHPVSPRLRIHLAAAAEAEGIAIARGGTYLCMEGPQFSSYAESMTYKNLGYSVIGMTNMPEAKLAREAEICYATVAMVTDFDCWHPDHDAVTVQDIIRVLTTNADKAKGLVARLAREFPREHEPCPIGSDRALDTAIITAPEARDPALLKKLDAVAGRILRG